MKVRCRTERRAGVISEELAGMVPAHFPRIDLDVLRILWLKCQGVFLSGASSGHAASVLRLPRARTISLSEMEINQLIYNYLHLYLCIISLYTVCVCVCLYKKIFTGYMHLLWEYYITMFTAIYYISISIRFSGLQLE